jgi:flagellar motor protein MotB
MIAGISMLTLAGLSGCDGDLKAQNEALYKENQELHDRLKTTQEALDSAEADRAKMAEQMANANKPATTGTAPIPVGKAGANTGFGNIGDGIEVTSDANRVTVKIPGDVLFDSGKATLKTSSQRSLDKIAGVLQSQYAGNAVRVEGHTDTDPIRKSNWPSNQALSEARAAAVQKYLASRGVSRATAVGLGSSQPKATKAASRRVEIIVVK